MMTTSLIKGAKRTLSTAAFITMLMSTGPVVNMPAARSQTKGSIQKLNSPKTTAYALVGEKQQSRITATYAQPSLAFEENRGQTDPDVKFIARGSGYSLFLTSTQAVLTLRKAKIGRTNGLSELHGKHSDDPSIVRMKLNRAGGESQPIPLETLPGRSSYFRGKDPSGWHTQIKHYRRIKYENVYPGIDVVFYGNQRELEFDFIVSPGADPNLIELTFEGAEDVYLGETGQVMLRTARGSLELKKPLVYQEVEGTRKEVASNYILKSVSAGTNSNGKSVGLQLASYDHARSLVIDPVLSYATYLGGTGFEEGYAIAVDSTGNAYVTGVTASLDFPTVDAVATGISSDDVFVAKISPNGDQLLYSAYLGGSKIDRGLAIAVDSLGNAYVTGETFSADFPTTPSAYDRIFAGSADAFIAKLSPNGESLLYSTYLGGSNGESGSGLAIDSVGNAYVVGSTNSPDFPTTEGAFDRTCGTDANCDPYFPPGSHFCAPLPCEPWKAYDAFVIKLSPDGAALIYGTYLGGNSNDGASDIALDGQGNAYVTGSTTGSFPTQNAFQSNLAGGFVGDFCIVRPCPDAFIAKLNAQGSALLYSTYLGGSAEELGAAITIDPSGNAYVVGTTYSPDFPATPGAYQSALNSHSNAFVVKLNSTGSTLVNSTFLGGGFNENWGAGIALDRQGNVYVAGLTQSSAFPTVSPISPSLRGTRDVFVTKFDRAMASILYSTYLGGEGLDSASAIAVRPNGDAYIVGSTNSEALASPDALQPNYGGGVSDAFVARIRGPFIDNAAPAGGEIWPVGTTQIISWNSGDVGGDVIVQLSRNGGSTWKKLFQSSVSTGSRSWKVSGPGTSHATIRVCSVRTPQICSAGSSFAITPYYQVVSPNGGEVWPAGTSQTVQWNAVGDTSNVKIEISRNGGWQWQTLFSSVPNTGSQNWTVTGPATSAARIRVRRAGSSTPADTTNANFSIQ